MTKIPPAPTNLFAESEIHSLIATYGAACGLHGMATERYAVTRADADRADAQSAAHDAERARLDLLRAIGLDGMTGERQTPGALALRANAAKQLSEAIRSLAEGEEMEYKRWTIAKLGPNCWKAHLTGKCRDNTGEFMDSGRECHEWALEHA